MFMLDRLRLTRSGFKIVLRELSEVELCWFVVIVSVSDATLRASATDALTDERLY